MNAAVDAVRPAVLIGGRLFRFRAHPNGVGSADRSIMMHRPLDGVHRALQKSQAGAGSDPAFISLLF